MKRRTRITYTDEQKAMIWDRWQKGETMGSIARLFDRQFFYKNGNRKIRPTGCYEKKAANR